MVDHASDDDELFAGGYLRGHLTLAVAELEGEGEHSAEAVHSKVSHSPEKAIGAGCFCRRRTKFWCRAWENLYLQGQKSGLSYVVARVRRQPYPGNCLPSWFYFTAFPSAVFSPIADLDSAPPVSLSSGSGSALICAASISALNGAVQICLAIRGRQA